MRALHAVLFIVHIAIYCTIVRADALSVDTLFEVDFSTDDNGGCRTIGRQRLQSMLNEAETLARIGKQLVGDYSSSAEAKRLLDVLVKGNTDSDRSTLESTLPVPVASLLYYLLNQGLSGSNRAL
jgi:hypothetical protein